MHALKYPPQKEFNARSRRSLRVVLLKELDSYSFGVSNTTYQMKLECFKKWRISIVNGNEINIHPRLN